MKSLLEIAKILTKKKITKIEILDEQILKQKDSKFGKFYEGLLTGKIESDEDAALMLYESSDPGDAKYRQLKSRFRRRLLNTLFFLDINTPLTSNYEQAYLGCSKELALVDILLSYQARTSALALCRQVLTTALKFHVTEMVVTAARRLRELAIYEEHEKNFYYYNELVQEYNKRLELEIQAEQLNLEATEIYQKNTCRSNCIMQMEAHANTLVQLQEKANTPRLHFYTFNVWGLYYEVCQDYEGVLEVSNNALAYLLENESYFSNQEKTIFLIRILSAYLHLNDFEEGKKHAEQNLAQLPEATLAWVDFMEYYLLLSLRSAQVINAIAIFNKVTSSTIFRRADKERQEKWNLYEAVLYYLAEKQGAPPGLLPRQRRKSFKLSDFINRTINFPQHLSGLSVQNLTWQMLFLLKRKSYSAAASRIDQLRKIAKYELKKEGYERAFAFVKLLSQLEKANFDLKNLKQDEKYTQLLKDTPYLYRGRVAELEILPYELIWELILKQLK